jgi:hypothetical protein
MEEIKHAYKILVGNILETGLLGTEIWMCVSMEM